VNSKQQRKISEETRRSATFSWITSTLKPGPETAKGKKINRNKYIYKREKEKEI
jgi:hypothetical protein